jgi:hypothetical protein
MGFALKCRALNEGTITKYSKFDVADSSGTNSQPLRGHETELQTADTNAIPPRSHKGSWLVCLPRQYGQSGWTNENIDC